MSGLESKSLCVCVCVQAIDSAVGVALEVLLVEAHGGND